MIVPEGKIAAGKLAQALMHGARVIALRGNFDEALEIVRDSPHAPDRARQLGQPAPDRGPEDGRVRDRRGARRAIDGLCIPVGNAGNITAYWKGFQEVGQAPEDARLPGRGRGAARARPARREARDGRERDPDRQPGALGGGDGGGDRSAAASRPSATPRSSTPTGCSPPREGVFCEPASAASVAGLLKHGRAAARERIVCVLTGHGLKDPQTALEQAGSVVPCEPDARAVEQAILA